MYYACVFGDAKPEERYDVLRPDDPVDWTVYLTTPSEVQYFIDTACAIPGDACKLREDLPLRGDRALQPLLHHWNYWSWLHGREGDSLITLKSGRTELEVEEVVATMDRFKEGARKWQDERRSGADSKTTHESSANVQEQNAKVLGEYISSISNNISVYLVTSKDVLTAEKDRVRVEGPSSTPKGVAGGWWDTSLPRTDSKTTLETQDVEGQEPAIPDYNARLRARRATFEKFKSVRGRLDEIGDKESMAAYEESEKQHSEQEWAELQIRSQAQKLGFDPLEEDILSLGQKVGDVIMRVCTN